MQQPDAFSRWRNARPMGDEEYLRIKRAQDYLDDTIRYPSLNRLFAMQVWAKTEVGVCANVGVTAHVALICAKASATVPLVWLFTPLWAIHACSWNTMPIVQCNLGHSPIFGQHISMYFLRLRQLICHYTVPRYRCEAGLLPWVKRRLPSTK